MGLVALLIGAEHSPSASDTPASALGVVLDFNDGARTMGAFARPTAAGIGMGGRAGGGGYGGLIGSAIPGIAMDGRGGGG
eukprot:scaffold282979_cov32-Tisochrysis_lutea.AAC.4